MSRTFGRVALVHERITELGGSERVVEQLHRIFPDAPVHVGLFDPRALPPGLRDAEIVPSGAQRFYRGGRDYAHLLPILPLAMRRMDFGDVDLVITSHHAFTNRVKPPSDVPVVSYTHTPARWLWEPATRQHEVGGTSGRMALTAFAALQRPADRAAAQRLSGVMANSRHVAKRIATWWGRHAKVVPPPVDVEWFRPDPGTTREDFFLLAGRLVPYKRPDIAIEAANRLGVRLVVAGDGRMFAGLERIAGPSVELMGSVDAETLRDLFRRCRALVFPGEEDFGIVPVEAQACGAPVIAARVGGILDSVLEGTTGQLYQSERGAEVASLTKALEQFDDGSFDPAKIRSHAMSFAPDHFASAFRLALTEILGP